MPCCSGGAGVGDHEHGLRDAATAAECDREDGAGNIFPIQSGEAVNKPAA